MATSTTNHIDNQEDTEFVSADNLLSQVQDDPNESTVVTLPARPVAIEHWPQVDPQYVLNELKTLKEPGWANGKKFFLTYNSWSKLTNDQKGKTKAYWTALSEPVNPVWGHV